MKRVIRKVLGKLGYEVRRLTVDAPPQTTVLVKQTLSVSELLSRIQRSSHVKLHFGCGPRILKDWINIDLAYIDNGNDDYLEFYTDKYYPLELRGDHKDYFAMNAVEAPWPFPNDSVDVIFHEDFIEHLNQRDQFCFLAESYRVLKPGAIHRVNTPNVAYWMRQNNDFSKGMKTVPVDWIWNQWHHFNVLSPVVLEEMAKIIGYSRVIFTARDKSNSTLIPLEYRPDASYAPEEANLYADLVK